MRSFDGPSRLGVALSALVVSGGWAAWQAWQVKSDFERLQSSATAFRVAVDSGDGPARDRAIEGLQRTASLAEERTDPRDVGR